MFEHQNEVLAILEAFENAFDFAVARIGGIDHEQDEVGILRATPGGRDHCAVEPPLRFEDARRIDEQDLRPRPDAQCPSARARVVCAFGLTIATFCPTSAFTSVDLPALGAPIDGHKACARFSRSLQPVPTGGGRRRFGLLLRRAVGAPLRQAI